MSALIFDKRDEYKGRPCMHAFIIGVSAYPNLPTEGEPTDTKPPTLGMQQLSSSALAAYQVYRWLIDYQAQLNIPLATCRLLLTPSPAELAAEPALSGLADPATIGNFDTAAHAWREDAKSHSNGVTFFYFAGHGVQRKGGDHVMLLEGFGDGGKPLLYHAVDTGRLIAGMAPFPTQEQIAHTQMYFVDACRITPEAFAEYEELSTYVLWDTPKAKVDNRITPVFFTTVPGRGAYGVKGKGTIFSRALIDCLSGGAAVEGKCVDSEGQPQWCVTVNSLNDALEYYLEKINRDEGTEQDFNVHGTGRNVIITRLTDAPYVDVVLRVVPSTARDCVRVRVINDDDDLIWEPPVPIKPHPFEDRVQAGTYRIGAKIEPPTKPYSDAKHKSIYINPPRKILKVEVGS